MICLNHPIYATTTLTIQPDIGDAYVRNNAPDNNFGTSADLRLTNYSAGEHRTYIKFNISSIPTDATIIEAVLGLRATATVNPYQTYSYHVNNQTWSETDITWNTQMCFFNVNSTSSVIYSNIVPYNCSKSNDLTVCTNAYDLNNGTFANVAQSQIGIESVAFNFSINQTPITFNISVFHLNGDSGGQYQLNYSCVYSNGSSLLLLNNTYGGSSYQDDISVPTSCFYDNNLTINITTDNQGDGGFLLKEISSTYEGTITAIISRNQCNGTPMDSQLWQGALGDWFTIGVKPAIDAERLLTNENVSFMIVDNSTLSATTKFSSKEGADSPMLNVTYSIPSNITVTLSLPANASSSTVTTPTFEFQVSSTYTGEPLQAYVYVNGKLVGSNASVVNGTSTSITSNTSLTSGDYQWYVYVVQDLSTGQSDNMTFTITAPVTPPTATEQQYNLVIGIIPIIMALGIIFITMIFAIGVLKGAISAERIMDLFIIIIIGVIFTSIAVTLLG